MEITSTSIRPPSGVNVIIGQAHFIKTVDGIAESVATTVPQAVIDGMGPKGVEGPGDVAARKSFLRELGYKR